MKMTTGENSGAQADTDFSVQASDFIDCAKPIDAKAQLLIITELGFVGGGIENVAKSKGLSPDFAHTSTTKSSIG